MGPIRVVSEVGSGSAPFCASLRPHLPAPPPPPPLPAPRQVRRGGSSWGLPVVTCDAHLAERQDSSDYPLMAGDLALNLAAAEPADFPWRSAASWVGSRHSNSSWGSTPQNPSAGGLALSPRGPGTAHFPALEPEARGESHRLPGAPVGAGTTVVRVGSRHRSGPLRPSPGLLPAPLSPAMRSPPGAHWGPARLDRGGDSHVCPTGARPSRRESGIPEPRTTRPAAVQHPGSSLVAFPFQPNPQDSLRLPDAGRGTRGVRVCVCVCVCVCGCAPGACQCDCVWGRAACAGWGLRLSLVAPPPSGRKGKFWDLGPQTSAPPHQPAPPPGRERSSREDQSTDSCH